MKRKLLFVGLILILCFTLIGCSCGKTAKDLERENFYDQLEKVAKETPAPIYYDKDSGEIVNDFIYDVNLYYDIKSGDLLGKVLLIMQRYPRIYYQTYFDLCPKNDDGAKANIFSPDNIPPASELAWKVWDNVNNKYIDWEN